MNNPEHTRMRRNVLKVAGLVALAALSLAYLVRPGFAADLAAPPQKIDAQGNVKNPFTGCYGQGHGVIATFQAESVSEVVKNFGIGAGCDWQVNSAVIGAGITYDFGEARELGLNGRIGMTVNPYLLIYGKVDLRMDGKSPDLRDSIVAVGLGGETFIGTQFSVFGEATKDVHSFGAAKELDAAWRVLGGIRIRLN